MRVKPRLAEGTLRGNFTFKIAFTLMLTTVEGVYQDGVIKLTEQPAEIQPGALALVTFLSAGHVGGVVDLRSYGIGPAAAAELRARLSTFAEDWDSPEMSAYDDYHAAKSRP